MRSLRSCKFLVAVCCLVQLVGMLMFAISFFSAEEALFQADGQQDRETLEEKLNDNNFYFAIESRCSKEKKPAFHKMVLVVIDALRADFVPSISHKVSAEDYRMPFTESKLKTNGIGMVSVAATPTVTMPRIKAMLSGQLPSFMDYILNLSAYKFNGENLVELAWSVGKKIVFFGDDTWVHLFPRNVFVRSNETFSFFSTDYVQVDTNVTYNVEKELERLEEWDLMILHYLGVDHIGHTHGGAYSKLMPKKLREMDQVIQMIFEKTSARQEPYLIVVTGDHGMTDIGNHGGNTEPETDTALMFISTKHNQKLSFIESGAKKVRQLDMAATISTFLGLPIPSKSQGKVIVESLMAMNQSKNQLLCALFENSIQTSKLNPTVTKLLWNKLNHALEMHLKYLNQDQSVYHFSLQLYEDFISDLQNLLLSVSNKRSATLMLTLSIILSVIPIAGIVWTEFSNLLTVPVKDASTFFAFVCVSFNIIFLASTSFIESEHDFWFFMTSSWFVIYLFISIKEYLKIIKITAITSLHHRHLNKIILCILVLVILRLTNQWKQEVGNWLMSSQNKSFLSAAMICSLTAISYLMSTKRFGKQQCILISGLVWVYIYRSSLGSVSAFRIPFIPQMSCNIRAQLVYFHASLILLETLIKKINLKVDFNWSFVECVFPEFFSIKRQPQQRVCLVLRTFLTIWVLLSALFQKVHNIPLLALNILLEKVVHHVTNRFRHDASTSNWPLAITYLCFAYSAHYSLGNSNTLSTIDVSPAFVGLDSYRPWLAALFMIVNTFSLFVYWMLMFFIRLKETFAKSACFSGSLMSTPIFLSLINALLTQRFITIGFYMCVAVLLQNHLFIWSVICPKFLYEASFTLLTDLIVLVVVTSNLID